MNEGILSAIILIGAIVTAGCVVGLLIIRSFGLKDTSKVMSVSVVITIFAAVLYLRPQLFASIVALFQR